MSVIAMDSWHMARQYECSRRWASGRNGILPLGLVAWLCCLLAIPGFSADIDFNRDIRPILSEQCFYCHGQDANKREGSLRLDQRDAAMESGAIQPGDIEASELIARIVSEDPDTMMPPPKSNRRLTPAQKETLKEWIASGASYSKHWAFETPRRPNIPGNHSNTWAQHPIDAFVNEGHGTHGLQPNPVADRTTLIKRLYADLIGIPPEPEEVDRFVQDADPLAYERLVDRLLADPAYGQRMSLSWLDAARYADSNGFQQDGDTWQWLWRDWVVRAMNANLPFDDFTIWQIAGDLLPDATTDQKIASGFNRNHLLNGEGGAIAEEQRFVILFDRIDTTATTWLGLTMACAQCHDHKYDPITMRDYYGLMDAFNRVPESGVPQYFSSRIRVAPPLLELPTEENQRRIAELETRIGNLDKESQPLLDAAYQGWRLSIAAASEGLPANLADLLKKPERSDEEKKSLEEGLRKHFNEKSVPALQGKIAVLGQLQGVRNELNAYRADQIPRPMVMSDAQPRETFMLERGEYLKPRDKINFNTPAFLPPLPDDAPRNRLGLARWLVSPEHPLTSRVHVNRMWQHFFGSGIIKTVEDFGVQSEYPYHGKLLDYLAVAFRDSGWDTKWIQKNILSSATYQQSSRATPEKLQADPENRWFARASRFRLPSLVLRDWALSAASLLDMRIGGAPVYPYQPEGIWDPLAITKERDFSYPASSGANLYRKSLYTFWRRTVGPANMFDASNRQACRVRASQTSTPLHALTTLNDPTWVEAAKVLAQNCILTSQEPQSQLRMAFRRIVAREPNEKEMEVLGRAYQHQLAIYQADPGNATLLLETGAMPRLPNLDPATHAALCNVCLTLFNLDESLCRE
jgi:hypothetical protein